MKNFKKVDYDSYLLGASVSCCLLVILRFFITSNPYYFFLIWNLFLAAVPYFLSQVLESGYLQKFSLVFIGSWLLFLPNSFYVITDLIHLKNSSLPVYDGFMIFSFALLCTGLGFQSMKKMSNYAKMIFPKGNPETFKIPVLFLCSFGIFLGRFLRYNSWNILNKPHLLFTDCLNFILYPLAHIKVWAFTIGFGLMLTGLYYIYLKMTEPKNAI